MKTKIFLGLAATLLSTMAFAEITIPAQVLERHNNSCPEFADAEAGKYLMRESYKLPKSEYSSEKTLYILGCEMYAYNSSEKAYIVDSFSTTDVAVTEVTSDGSFYATSDLMGTAFDLETLTLSTYQKGIGTGVCGSAFTYKYDTYTTKFILTEARVKDSCKDDGEEGIEWPIVYKK